MKHYINGLTELEDKLDKDTCYVLDTNYLLGALSSVKYKQKYFKEIMKKEINIYIPFIVWVEFNYNLQSTLKKVNGLLDGAKTFLNSCEKDTLGYEIEDVKAKLKESFNNSIVKKNSVATAISQDTEMAIDKLVEGSERLGELISEINEEITRIFSEWEKDFRDIKNNEIEGHISNTKELLEEFQTHINNSASNINIGEEYSLDKLKKFIELCKCREEKNYYPGISKEDLEKQGIRLWGDLEIPQKYGDILLWLELIEFAKCNPAYEKYILVSDDVNKDDWVIKNTNDFFAQLPIEFFSKTNRIISHLTSYEFINKLSPEISREELKKDYIVKTEEVGDLETDSDFSLDLDGVDYLDENDMLSDIMFEELLEENKYKDTIVVPARPQGFYNVFVGEDRWYSIPISKERIPYLRYIAAYRTSPISAVTHVAKIKKIVPSPYDLGKKMVLFDGSAVELTKSIRRGKDYLALQSPRYTNFKKLLTSQTVDDLFDFSELDDLFKY